MSVTLALGLASIANAAPDPDPDLSGYPSAGQLAELRFHSGSARVPLNVTPLLSQAVGWAAAHPDGLIVIEGHTDRTGPTELNRPLALARAVAARDALLAAGVDPRQIIVTTFGEDRPRGEADAANRRVLLWATRAGRAAVIAYATSRHGTVVSLGPAPWRAHGAQARRNQSHPRRR